MPSPARGYRIREFDSVICTDGDYCQESVREISRFRGGLPL
jgi:hypothetical protein